MKKTIGITCLIQLLLLCSCTDANVENSTSPEDWNVIIIVSDALRADHLGCYGYHRDTSPFLDSLARRGVRFENALSNSSYTRESVSSIFSGQLPSRSGSFGFWAHPSPDSHHIGEIIQKSGYRTGFFSTTAVLKNPEFTKGFDSVGQLVDQWDISGMSDELSQQALDFVRDCTQQNFMLYLHYLDPHAPYAPSKESYQHFSREVFSNPISLYDRVRPRCGNLVKKGFGPGEERFEDLVLRYDAEIREVDDAIRDLCIGLDRLGELNNTLIIFTSDHGEEFLDHGFVEHAWTLYHESIHVPLIFYAPELLIPGVYSDRVSLVDILPTVLCLLNISVDNSDFDGIPLFERQESGFQHIPYQKAIISELLLKHRCVLRTIIDEDWKYIEIQKGLSLAEKSEVGFRESVYIQQFAELPFDIWKSPEHIELYHLSVDPLEKKNLANQEVNQVEAFEKRMKAYQEKCLCFGTVKWNNTGDIDSLPEKDRKQLKSLGYID